MRNFKNIMFAALIVFCGCFASKSKAVDLALPEVSQEINANSSKTQQDNPDIEVEPKIIPAVALAESVSPCPLNAKTGCSYSAVAILLFLAAVLAWYFKLGSRWFVSKAKGTLKGHHKHKHNKKT